MIICVHDNGADVLASDPPASPATDTDERTHEYIYIYIYIQINTYIT